MRTFPNKVVLSMQKVLLAEDETEVANVTAATLRFAGFDVVHAYDGNQALEMWRTEKPNLIILDIQMPILDGFAVCRRIRAASDIPIIMLTGKDDEDNVSYGLNIGANDYMRKPFRPKELVARVQATLRHYNKMPMHAQFNLGGLSLDMNKQALIGDDGIVRLTLLEFRLLHYLLMNRGQIIPTDTILNYVWGSADSTDRAMLKQLVYRLRQKIESTEQQLIETIPGVGYTIGLGALQDVSQACSE
jgi:DNA-binding response OmpR family regulator